MNDTSAQLHVHLQPQQFIVTQMHTLKLAQQSWLTYLTPPSLPIPLSFSLPLPANGRGHLNWPSDFSNGCPSKGERVIFSNLACKLVMLGEHLVGEIRVFGEVEFQIKVLNCHF